MNREFHICSRCIMDTSDPDISFDDDGVCNHCHFYERYAKRWLLDGECRDQECKSVVDTIKRAGQGKEYDCIIGISGGVDSSYVAYLSKELGLRPLAVHLDNGWNSELAVMNIEKLLKRLGIDLFTHVIDWDEFKELQLAFLRASTPDGEIPTDHAIVALMYQMAAKFGVRYILTGYNIKTESIMPQAWSQGHYDWRYIKKLNQAFGEGTLRTYPKYGLMSMVNFFLFRRIQFVNILNYVEYDKANAMKLLEDKFAWQYYGGKHYESIYTRFYQGVLLPQKFGFDKRRAHLSTLINSEQISRGQALSEMKLPPCAPEQESSDREYVIKKLGLTEDEFNEIMNLPPKFFSEYPSYQNSLIYKLPYWLLQRISKLPQFIKQKLLKKRKGLI